MRSVEPHLFFFLTKGYIKIHIDPRERSNSVRVLYISVCISELEILSAKIRSRYKWQHCEEKMKF